MVTSIWHRKNLPGFSKEGFDRLVNVEENLEPVVDSTDHFGFKDMKGHQMQVITTYLEPRRRAEPDVGPCLHIHFYCPECDVHGQRKIYMDGRVKFPRLLKVN